ncbi:TPA: DUF192 domain-containing protein [Candidatus Ventrenecus stercoripullorum]|nr:DUF192 domain-containing protein [Candidatus Ventrenecus stercoripullorum]
MKLKCNGKKIEIKNATNFTTRLVGLIGKKDINYGILFPKCNAIHTFFMKQEIDVVGINEENQVIYIYRNVPKNKIVRIKDNAKKTSILELPKNASKSFVIGSIIKWEE